MDAEVLWVAEGPGNNEVAEGIGLVGWSGIFLNEASAYYGVPRIKIRVENIFEHKTKYASKEGRQAASICGRTIWDVIKAMPNLRMVMAFGEAALRELTGYREWNEAYKLASAAHTKSVKARASWEKKCAKQRVSHEKKLTKWQEKKAKLVLAYEQASDKKRPKARERFDTCLAACPILETPVEPVVGAIPDAQQVGHTTITNYRGSPLRLYGYPEVWLFPVIHPAACVPKRQPRLRPLILADIRKAMEFYQGKRQVIKPAILPIQTAEQLEALFGLLRAQEPANARIGLDIEWSRKLHELVLIGIGAGTLYGVVEFARKDGWRMDGMERSRVFSILQREFDAPAWSWGGHNIPFDENMLERVGLKLRSKWDSLSAFHILHADLGSAKDEESVEAGKKHGSGTAGGYDLGFCTSVMTNFPYHKGVLSASIDALDVEPMRLLHYCGMDVAASWHAMEAMHAEGLQWMPKTFEGELLEELALVRAGKRMSQRGVPIDEPLRQSRLAYWLSEQQKYDAQAKALQGPEFNIGSSAQLGKALEARGLKVRVKSETGNFMLDGNEIEKLGRKYTDPLLSLALDYRSAQKEAEAYEELAPWADGNAHPQWKAHGTIGTRFSSTPNYQNKTRSTKGYDGQRCCIGR